VFEVKSNKLFFGILGFSLFLFLDNRDEEEPAYLGFEPGAIHKQEFRPFWRDVLKADEWVLNTLEKGYMIPFSSSPTQYEEQNKYGHDLFLKV